MEDNAPKAPRQAPIEYDRPLSRPAKAAFRISAVMFVIGITIVTVLAAVAIAYIRGGG
ncbi:hypothetical protein [Brevundimonas nasdae]|uniref:Uncharacterized protein n=1 Tax=Brevundimonas nasdae TaxID=172043 RepID=A0ABX8TLN1_9CAUL|nr:hypothetical protein [Brevundimonas nasdae]QYC10680.1 hypothetical protein KWG56_01275 [Brevundimonas nasdae]QYC13467.1 hypothetical protein KWG63_14830 [Brevundimonas nasdae]